MIALDGIKKPALPGIPCCDFGERDTRVAPVHALKWAWDPDGLVFAGRFQHHLPQKLDPFVQGFHRNTFVVAADAAFAGLANE